MDNVTEVYKNILTNTLRKTDLDSDYAFSTEKHQKGDKFEFIVYLLDSNDEVLFKTRGTSKSLAQAKHDAYSKMVYNLIGYGIQSEDVYRERLEIY